MEKDLSHNGKLMPRMLSFLGTVQRPPGENNAQYSSGAHNLCVKCSQRNSRDIKLKDITIKQILMLTE